MFQLLESCCTAHYAKIRKVAAAAGAVVARSSSAVLLPSIQQRRGRKSTSQSRKAAAVDNPLRDTSGSANRRRHERQASRRQHPTSQKDFANAKMSYQQRQYPNLVSAHTFLLVVLIGADVGQICNAQSVLHCSIQPHRTLSRLVRLLRRSTTYDTCRDQSFFFFFLFLLFSLFPFLFLIGRLYPGPRGT